jgi:hypothetical protein
MSDIAAGLFRCPPPLRKPLAEQLAKSGVRMNPYLATVKLVLQGPENLGNWRPGQLENLPNATQPDPAEKLTQVRAIANALTAIPVKELRPAIANDLFQLGARIDPVQPPEVPSRYEPFEIVRQFAPELAEQMQAAQTEEDRERIREQIRHRHGTRIAEISEGIEQLGEQP